MCEQSIQVKGRFSGRVFALDAVRFPHDNWSQPSKQLRYFIYRLPTFNIIAKLVENRYMTENRKLHITIFLVNYTTFFQLLVLV